jgi:tetratricopeptide (TPR) repeat protein
MRKNLKNEQPELLKEILALTEQVPYHRDAHEENIALALQAYDLIPRPVEQWNDPLFYVSGILSEEYFKLKQWDEAIKWGRVAVETSEDRGSENRSFATWVSLGECYYKAGDPDNAFDCFDMAYNKMGMKNRAFQGFDPEYFDFYRERAGIPIKKKASKKEV